MSIDTLHLLQRALNRMREECNRMSPCLNKYNVRQLVEEHAQEGLMEEARQFKF